MSIIIYNYGTITMSSATNAPNGAGLEYKQLEFSGSIAYNIGSGGSVNVQTDVLARGFTDPNGLGGVASLQITLQLTGTTLAAGNSLSIGDFFGLIGGSEWVPNMGPAICEGAMGDATKSVARPILRLSTVFQVFFYGAGGSGALPDTLTFTVTYPAFA